MKKLSLFILSALLISSCSSPTPNTPTDHNSMNHDQMVEEHPVSLTVTTKENGVENPLGPEDLSSILIDGETIPASEIKIESKPFETKAESNSNYTVTYEGAGKYYIVNKKTGKALENLALIKFNLLNLESEVLIPIIQGIFEDNLRITIDLSTGNIYGGLLDEDGTLDDTKPVFKIGTDGLLTVITPDDKEIIFSSNENKIKEETITDLNKNETKDKIIDVKNLIAAKSPIDNFAGLWLYKGLGQKIILDIKNIGEGKFEASATILDKPYKGIGEYDPEVFTSQLNFKIEEDNLDLDINSNGNNSLQLILKDTSSDNLKTFKNVPVNLQRVITTD